jgi:hypothetical protein
MVNIATSGSTLPCTAGLTATSVTPNHVIDGTTTTVIIKGSGFTSLMHADVTLNTPSGGFADVNNKTVRVVNDTEIDLSGTFSAPGGYAFFSVTVFDNPPTSTSPPNAVCSGCLSIDAG